MKAALVLIMTAAASLAGCARGADPELRMQVDGHQRALAELPGSFYTPGLGDLMHALQLRHAKLWFAGRAGNWELAAFEAHELHESLDRVALWHADSEEIPMAPSIKAYMQPGRYALDQSIAQRNPTAFTAAFDRFTEGCNDCHRAAKHGFIVIQRPTVEPWSNQRWTP